MKTRLVRCYKGFASLAGKFNIEVFYTIPEMGYWNKLFVCVKCGALFVLDSENPRSRGRTIEDIVSGVLCPKCNSHLRETIRDYPQNFLTDDGSVGHFEPERIIPPDSQSITKEFFEITV